MRHFQGPVLWCGECYESLLSGEVLRVCERWDKDPTPAGERYRALFRAARAVRRAGIEDDNQLLPTLVFAARSFELTNLTVLRGRLAEAEAGGEEWRGLKGTVRRAFDTFELLRVQDGVPIFYSRPFKVRAHIYQETGVVEKVVVEVYRRSAKGEEIGEWYDALLSKHGVSYEGRQGGFGWHASTDRLRMVFHRLAPATLAPLLEGRIEVDPGRNNLPLPHPDIVASLCEALIGSVGKRGKGSGFASVLGGRNRGRPFDPAYLIPAVVAWYVGGRGTLIKQHDLKPRVSRILRENLDDDLLSPRGKTLFHDKGWDSAEYIWKVVERISQPVLRVDHELREGYFDPLGYIFPEQVLSQLLAPKVRSSRMGEVPHIGEAARRSNVAPEHPWTLAREGRVPRERRDPNGRVCSELDLALLRAMGVGRRPRRLMSLEELPGLRREWGPHRLHRSARRHASG